MGEFKQFSLFDEAEEEFEDRFKPSVLEYNSELRAVVDACGQVGYYWKMIQNLKVGVKKVKDVADKYQHDLSFYREQLDFFRKEARKAFTRLGLQAAKFGYPMPFEKDFLNNLALYGDRRECYKYYLKNCEKKNTTMAPHEMESKYQIRLRKRVKKKEG